MNKYLKNILISFTYGGCFGIIYNVIVYLLSTKVFSGYAYYYKTLPIFLYKRVDEETFSLLAEVFSNNLFLIILNGFFSDFLNLTMYGLIYMAIMHKIDSAEIKTLIWKKILVFTFISTLMIAILFFIGTYIWAINNREVSWFPSGTVFEWHLPTIYFAHNKSIYIFFSFVLSLLFYSKIKKQVQATYI